MADQSKYEDILNDLIVIRDETSMHANTATRVGEAMIKLLHFTEDRAKEIEEEIGQGHGGDSYWEEYKDPESGKVSVKLKDAYAGAWANGFISSLGMSDMGSSLLLGEFLTALNEADLAAHPDAAGKTVVWNGTAWVFGTAGGGTDMNDVWTALAGNTTEQINVTHLSNALNAYATKSWVEDQGYLTNESYRGTVTSVATGTGLTGGTITSSGTISINSTYQNYISHGQTAYTWGNHADVGYFKRLQSTLNINFEDKNNLNGIFYINKDVQGGNTVGFWADYGSVLNLSNEAANWQFGMDSGNTLKFRSRWWSAGGREWTEWKTIPMVTGTTLKVWGQTYCSNGQLRDVTGNILMDNNTHVRIKASSGNYDLSCITVDSGNNFVIGETVDINGHNTYIRGSYINFQSVKNGVRSWVAAITNEGYLNIPGGIDGPRHIELNSRSNEWVKQNTDNGGYIDFHYGGTSQNFSTRIIEDTWGILSINSMNSSGAYSSAALRVGNGYDGSYIQIGNIRLIYNSTYNAIQVQHANGTAANLFATGGVSALGFTAPQSSIDNMTFDTLKVNNKLIIGDDNWYIKKSSDDLYFGSDGGYIFSNCRIDADGWVFTPYIRSDSGNNVWHIDDEGGALFSKQCTSPRFYFDSSRYLYVNGSILYYYNGQTSRAIAS